VSILEHVDTTTTSPKRARRVSALVVAMLAVVSFALAALPARAQTDPTDPTTTTQPAPDTTTTTLPPPDTTTTEPPPDTTTTLPGDTTTTVPGDTTTTEPVSEPTTTTLPLAAAGKLDPDEALVPRPEFGALSSRQRALVQELQTATDAYALRRFALVDLTNKLAAARDALKEARASENDAVENEIMGLAEVSGTDHDLTTSAFRKLQRRLEADRQRAHAARLKAQAAVTTATDDVAEQMRAAADALQDRKDAESAIEAELGPDAVRARPDGITATLVAEQAGQPDPTVVGGIELPIPGAAVSSPFGLRNDPLSGGAGFHPGMDLAASSGTPIHAAADGVVVTAGDCGGYGYCVVIDHGNSIATLYGHQSGLAVGVGQHVGAGEVIGYVGSTGLSTGPHLHFEVRLHGLPIDPVLALGAS
jgi:murein DD-endopeptidase MepM/ murein hydrolase activator NlpD